jgi:hypothetical protein
MREEMNNQHANDIAVKNLAACPTYAGKTDLLRVIHREIAQSSFVPNAELITAVKEMCLDIQLCDVPKKERNEFTQASAGVLFEYANLINPKEGAKHLLDLASCSHSLNIGAEGLGSLAVLVGHKPEMAHDASVIKAASLDFRGAEKIVSDYEAGQENLLTRWFNRASKDEQIHELVKNFHLLRWEMDRSLVGEVERNLKQRPKP